MRWVLILIFSGAIITNAQIKYTFSGTVKDSLSGEALIGAYILFPEAKTSCATNAYGFFSITLPGVYILPHSLIWDINQKLNP